MKGNLYFWLLLIVKWCYVTKISALIDFQELLRAPAEHHSSSSSVSNLEADVDIFFPRAVDGVRVMRSTRYPIFEVSELPASPASSESAAEAAGGGEAAPGAAPASAPSEADDAPAPEAAAAAVGAQGDAEGLGVQPPLLSPGGSPLPAAQNKHPLLSNTRKGRERGQKAREMKNETLITR